MPTDGKSLRCALPATRCRPPRISGIHRARATSGASSSALDLIEARYAEPLSVGAIAGAVHMSPYHFLRVFRAVAGVTPHQYLVRTRLRHAAIALATTDQPIADIAFAHGFGDLSTS